MSGKRHPLLVPVQDEIAAGAGGIEVGRAAATCRALRDRCGQPQQSLPEQSRMPSGSGW